MSQSEEVFNAREVAATLGIAGAMLRRYASEYEALSGNEVEIHRREGRLFTSEQVEVLKKARGLVSNQGLSVRAAVQLALDGATPMPLRHAEKRSEGLQESGMSFDALAQNRAFADLLTKAVQDGNQELLAEMRKLNEQLSSKSDASYVSSLETGKAHGLLVRFALWVEGMFRR